MPAPLLIANRSAEPSIVSPLPSTPPPVGTAAFRCRHSVVLAFPALLHPSRFGPRECKCCSILIRPGQKIEPKPVTAHDKAQIGPKNQCRGRKARKIRRDG